MCQNARRTTYQSRMLYCNQITLLNSSVILVDENKTLVNEKVAMSLTKTKKCAKLKVTKK